MKEDNVRFLQTLDWEDSKRIIKIAEDLNAKKERYMSKTNMQAIVRACVRYCLKKGLKFKTGWGKHVSVIEEETKAE